VAVKVPGWRLTYDLKGFPFVEPSFADIEPIADGDRTPEVQGVCHQITEAEWDGIVATEGGGGVIEHGYHPVTVNAIPLRGDQTPIQSISLSVGPSPVLKLNGQLHLPSKRYVDLIAEGAKHYQLDPEYIDWIETHDVYCREEHLRNSLVFYIAMAGVALLAIPVFTFFFLNTLLLRFLPKNIYRKWSWFSHTIIRHIGFVIWGYHDLLVKIFGSLGWITVETGGSKNVRCSPKVERSTATQSAPAKESKQRSSASSS